MSRHGTLRASDADRDQIVDRLHKAATEGRIASDELEQRVSQALKARTYSELEATVADLPGPRRSPAGQVQRHRSAGSWALSTVRANPALLLFVIPVLAVTAAMLLAATIVWSVLMVVVMILGGRRHGGPPSPPWVYAARRGARAYGRRGPGRHWA
jgi:hypothetical protein